MMTPDQERQKQRVREEAERHMHYSAVDRQRDEILARYEAQDAITMRDMNNATRAAKDANGVYAGEE